MCTGIDFNVASQLLVEIRVPSIRESQGEIIFLESQKWQGIRGENAFNYLSNCRLLSLHQPLSHCMITRAVVAPGSCLSTVGP